MNLNDKTSEIRNNIIECHEKSLVTMYNQFMFIEIDLNKEKLDSSYNIFDKQFFETYCVPLLIQSPFLVIDSTILSENAILHTFCVEGTFYWFKEQTTNQIKDSFFITQVSNLYLSLNKPIYPANSSNSQSLDFSKFSRNENEIKNLHQDAETYFLYIYNQIRNYKTPKITGIIEESLHPLFIFMIKRFDFPTKSFSDSSFFNSLSKKDSYLIFHDETPDKPAFLRLHLIGKGSNIFFRTSS